MQSRLKIGPIENPVRGLLHGSAAALWALGALALWRASGCPATARAALVVCALSQVGLYVASTLYHCAPWSPVAKKRMQRVDHSMIYVKIAGSLTPILALGLDDWRRPALLGAAWAIAAAGIAQKLMLPSLDERASIPAQVLQALLVLPAIAPFSRHFPGAPVALICLGAVLYGAGAVIFLTERPRLWPRVFSFHELFHALVVAGSGAHYALLAHMLARIP